MLPTLWFRNIWPPEGPRPVAEGWSRAPGQAPPCWWPTIPVLGQALPVRPAGRRAAVRRQRDQPLPLPRGAVRRQVLQGRDSTTTSSTTTGRPSTPSAPAPRPPCTTRSTVPAEGSASLRLRLTDSRPARMGSDPLGARRSPAILEAAARPRPTSSTPQTHPRARCPPDQRRWCARRWPACCGASSSTTTTSRPGWPSAGINPFNNGHARAPQRRLAPHGQRRRHLDARQMGVPLVRRLGSGLPRPAARHGRPGLRQAAAAAAAAGALPAPQRQVPAYEWNFGDVNPPVHAWAAYFLFQLDRAAHRARPTWPSSRPSSTSCC